MLLIKYNNNKAAVMLTDEVTSFAGLSAIKTFTVQQQGHSIGTSRPSCTQSASSCSSHHNMVLFAMRRMWMCVSKGPGRRPSLRETHFLTGLRFSLVLLCRRVSIVLIPLFFCSSVGDIFFLGQLGRQHWCPVF